MTVPIYRMLTSSARRGVLWQSRLLRGSPGEAGSYSSSSVRELSILSGIRENLSHLLGMRQLVGEDEFGNRFYVRPISASRRGNALTRTLNEIREVDYVSGAQLCQQHQESTSAPWRFLTGSDPADYNPNTVSAAWKGWLSGGALPGSATDLEQTITLEESRLEEAQKEAQDQRR